MWTCKICKIFLEVVKGIRERIWSQYHIVDTIKNSWSTLWRTSMVPTCFYSKAQQRRVEKKSYEKQRWERREVASFCHCLHIWRNGSYSRITLKNNDNKNNTTIGLSPRTWVFILWGFRFHKLRNLMPK
jgi:hypothetical protein